MERIGNLLGAALNRRGIKDQTDASPVLHQASIWLSKHLPEFAAFLEPSALLPDGTLLISCTHSVAAQECQQVLAHLLHHLREECGQTGIIRGRIMRQRFVTSEQNS